MQNIREILKAKKNNQKITMVTAYDEPSAKLAQEANMDIILVGDSMGNNVMGYPSTVNVNLQDIEFAVKMVKRGAPNTFIVGDLPLGSYQISDQDTIENSIRLIKAGANAVKLEGTNNLDTIKRLVNYGIPVMGHIGLLPQSINQLGGYRIQGKSESKKQVLLSQALELEKAGVFSIVLEMVEINTSKLITENLKIPTVGIGSGKYCDGQVLVWHDLLGINKEVPSFVKKYEDLHSRIVNALKNYVSDVKEEKFPN
jgi:3-methyl-2-oxobutanoate hydroxymethyltransferase